MGRRVVGILVTASMALIAACGGGGSGGSGGSGGAPSVLGTKESGGCAHAETFAEQGEAEGGILADHCQDALCTSEGHLATCSEPAPAPSASAAAMVVVASPARRLRAHTPARAIAAMAER